MMSGCHGTQAAGRRCSRGLRVPARIRSHESGPPASGYGGGPLTITVSSSISAAPGERTVPSCGLEDTQAGPPGTGGRAGAATGIFKLLA